LRDPDQHHTILIFSCGGFQIRQCHLLFVLALLKMHHRDLMPLGELVNGFDVGVADLAKSGRRGDSEFSLPAQEFAYVPHGLQLRHIGLQEDPVDTSAAECHAVP